MNTRPLSEFDINWPHGHLTRDGKKARIICRDVSNLDYGIVALVFEGGREVPRMYLDNGCWWVATRDHENDLINAPAPKQTWWVNVYANRLCTAWETRAEADSIANSERIACVQVTEGDGLEQEAAR